MVFIQDKSASCIRVAALGTVLALLVSACGGPTAPSSVALTANPTSIAPGGSALLTWTAITGATSCSIDNGVGAVSCNASSVTVMPATTTTYTFTATKTGATNTTGTATITVTGAGVTTTVASPTQQTPIMGTFTAKPSTIASGGTVTLSWAGIKNADHCLIDNAIGLVPCTDSSVTVKPMSTTTTYVQRYTFTAVGVLASVAASANVTVTP